MHFISVLVFTNLVPARINVLELHTTASAFPLGGIKYRVSRRFTWEASNLMEKASCRKASSAFRVKVVGSNPADPTTRGTGAGARIFRTLWELKKGGQSEDTPRAKGDRLRYLAKRVDLDDLEARA